MKNYQLQSWMSIVGFLLIISGIQGIAQETTEGQREKTAADLNLPQNIFAVNIFDGIPANPDLITEEHQTEKLGRNEAMENHWQLAGEWDTVIICSSECFKIVYTQHKDEYTIQSVKLTGKTPYAAKWSSYIGQNTDYLLRVFGVPKWLNDSAILYASNEYYIHFTYDKKIISAILLGREQ